MSPSRHKITTVRVVHRPSPESAELVELSVLAQEAGLRPELASRLVALGLVEPLGGTERSPLFAREAAARLARAERLRHHLALNLAGAVLACELLERIEDLDARLAAREAAGGHPMPRPRDAR